MRTIETKVFTFDELTKEAKQTAIQNIRESYWDYNEFGYWAIDNCYLFEPPHDELIDIFGTSFYFDLNKDEEYDDTPLITNSRKNIFFDCERGKFLDCAEAMTIRNDDYFLKWLGLTDEIVNGDTFSYEIYTPSFRNSNTTIDFEGFDSKFGDVIDSAIDKFDDHIMTVLQNISDNIDYRFTDEAIVEDIQANDYEFLENGDIF